MHLFHKNISLSFKAVSLVVFSLLAIGCGTPSIAGQLRPEVRVFIGEMVDRHGFERAELVRIFSKAKFQSAIIRAISQPVTVRPWYEYRPLFVNERRTVGGVTFWNNHAEKLERARKEYGLPEEIVTAVIEWRPSTALRPASIACSMHWSR